MDRIIKVSFLLVWLSALLGLPVQAAAGKPLVVATTTMIADMVADVGGDRIELRGLMNAGVDPHSYRPSRSDVLAMQKADLIFYNGHHLEGRMTDVLERMKSRKKRVYAVAEGIPEVHWMEADEGDGAIDPHLWFDPSIWEKGICVVVGALSEVDPEGKEYFEARGEALRLKYRGLADWAKSVLSEIPEEHRVLVTSHDAFGYFGRAFGFNVVGLQGISTLSEAGLGDVRRLADFIREQGVRAVFVESSLSPRLMERVSELSGAKVGGMLYSDAMGFPGDMQERDGDRYDTGTYAGMFKHNVYLILEGLK
jgi:manganese/zinc/iron transport system substrate-binding protein